MKFVLFGSTGDLAESKILPALLDLKSSKKLPKDFELIAVGRREYTTIDYLNFLKNDEINPLKQDISELKPTYLKIDWDNEYGFDSLWKKIDGDEQVIIYLSLGFDIVERTLTRFLDESSRRFFQSNSVRISLEKPFGGSVRQANQFHSQLLEIISEEGIFINDHVIFKAPVLDLDTPEKESILLSESYGADEFTVTYNEEIEVGDRAGFYDGKGVIVDMFQSHLLQIAAMSLHQCDLNDLKKCKARFIKSLELIPESVVRGQYEGYLNHKRIQEDSQTETFFKASFKSSLPEYSDTIFTFVSGKALAHKSVEIIIRKGEKFKTIQIQPCTGGLLELTEIDGKAYSRLIEALINQDSKYFVSLDEVMAQWQVTGKLLLARTNSPLNIYQKGSDWLSI